MIINYREIMKKIGDKILNDTTTDKEKKVFNKLSEWYGEEISNDYYIDEDIIDE